MRPSEMTQALCLLAAALAPQLVGAVGATRSACRPAQCVLWADVYSEQAAALCAITPRSATQAPHFEMCRAHSTNISRDTIQYGVRSAAASRVRWVNLQQRLRYCTAYVEAAICSRAHAHKDFVEGTMWSSNRGVQEVLLSQTTDCGDCCPDPASERDRAGECMVPIFELIYLKKRHSLSISRSVFTTCGRGEPDTCATTGTTISCQHLSASDQKALDALPRHLGQEAAILGQCSKELFAKSSLWNIRVQAAEALLRTNFAKVLLLQGLALYVICVLILARRQFFAMLNTTRHFLSTVCASLMTSAQQTLPFVDGVQGGGRRFTWRCVAEKILLAGAMKILAPCVMCAILVLVPVRLFVL